MPHHDKLNGLFSPAPGICLPGLCLSLLVLLSQAWPVTAQEQAPVDDASELAGLDIATELSSLVSAAQVNALNWLRFGGDPDTVVDEDGNTVMHYAAAHPYLDILQEAVRLGGHCNRRNAYGATPLHFAASKGTDATQTAAQAVRILARCEAVAGVRRACAADGPAEDQCRADPDAQDRRGNTPLHTLYEGLESTRGLAGRGEANAAVQRALLAVDADPNVRNHAGDTPLMPAIRYKPAMFTKPEHVSELLRHDADPDTRNKRGDTPLIETVSLDVNSINAEDDPAQVIVALLKHGADPDRRAGVGAGNSDTPLIRAARHEDDSVYEIEALLAGGADPCLRDRHGRLAYDHAADGSAGQQALYDAGGYPDPDTGLCVRDLRQAEEQEHQLSLDQETRQRIQSCLKSAGFDPGAQDGQFAPDTRAAIRAWQQAQGREGIEAAGYFAEGEADVLLEVCRDAGAGQTALAKEPPLIEPKAFIDIFRIDDYDGEQARLVTGREAWYEVDNKSNCYVFYHWQFFDAGLWWDAANDDEHGGKYFVYLNGNDANDFRVNWSGDCSNGVAVGNGVLKWVAGPEWKGELVNGKRHGAWLKYTGKNIYGLPPNSISMKGNYKHGKLDGTWYKTECWTYDDGTVGIKKYEFVSGELKNEEGELIGSRCGEQPMTE